MLNIDQEGKLQRNQPSYANFLPVHWMVKYDFGVADHQESPKKPLVQKNTFAKGREHTLMILGKLSSSVGYSERPMNVYAKNTVYKQEPSL